MTTLEKEDVKRALRELIQEDRAFFRDLLKEVFEDELQDAPSDRKSKVEAIIQKDFDRYKHVFKALA